MVGYQSNGVGSGYTMITPSFVNVGSAATEMDIDKMLAIEGATADKQCNIQVMNAQGKWLGMYYWMLEAEEDGVVYPAGWCDANYEPSGVMLNPGEAVYFSTSKTGLSVRSSGQVDALTLPLNAGYTMIGNGTPVELDADKMVINGATADKQCNIQVMNAQGKWLGMYYWMLEAEEDGVVYPAGWCDANYEPSGVVLDPGEAVYFSTSKTGLSMTIASPLAEKE